MQSLPVSATLSLLCQPLPRAIMRTGEVGGGVWLRRTRRFNVLARRSILPSGTSPHPVSPAGSRARGGPKRVVLSMEGPHV